MRTYRLVMSVVLFSFLPFFAHASDEHSAAEAELGDVVCSASVSKILPGDYNFCLGQKYWMAGRYESARQMLELAAGWGNKAAQRALGVAFFNGDGLAKDRSLGLAWLALAAERRESGAASLYNSALDQATADERRAAVQILDGLAERYSDEVAATRADSRFQRMLRAMSSNPVYGRGQCLPGAGGLAAAAAIDQSSDGHGGCSMAADDRFLAALERRYEDYSEGWSKKRVELGEAEVIPVR